VSGFVASACTAVLDRIAESDLVVLNKYGKLEAMQQGLAAAFEAAVSAGMTFIEPYIYSREELHRLLNAVVTNDHSRT